MKSVVFEMISYTHMEECESLRDKYGKIDCFRVQKEDIKM